MQIEIAEALGWVAVFIFGYLFGQIQGEKKAFIRTQEQKHREEASNAWMETLNKLGGGQ